MSMNLIPKSGLWSAVTCPQTLRFTRSTKAKHTLHFQCLLFLCQTFIFSCLDRLHLREANPLTASFIRMTSLNPFFDIGCVNPTHSLPDWLYYEAQILRVLKNGLFCIWEVPTPSLPQASVHAGRASIFSLATENSLLAFHIKEAGWCSQQHNKPLQHVL